MKDGTYGPAHAFKMFARLQDECPQDWSSVLGLSSLSAAHSLSWPICAAPQNLLVNTETHQLKLCDFGSAKVLARQPTAQRLAAGLLSACAAHHNATVHCFAGQSHHIYMCMQVLVKGEPNISYICSRYYRAPELIFGATDYTSGVHL